jgi:hypothetical protein
MAKVIGEANALVKGTDRSVSPRSKMKKMGRRFIFSSMSQMLIYF